jgi:colanic acid/amylovoran biosynthesis protein
MIAAEGRAVRILLDQAVYDQRNKGNVALLQAAVHKVSQLWPTATIEVLTEAPYLLKLYCPTVHPVSVHPWHNWSHAHQRFDRLRGRVPRLILQLLLELREEAWHRFPGSVTGEWRRKFQTRLSARPASAEFEQPVTSPSAEPSQDLEQAIQNADLVVATGGGYLCDVNDKDYTLQVFATLERAIQLGKPAVMAGQGVGPLNEPGLRARLGKLLPALELILIREPYLARPLLESLGVAPERVIMTGDDAIEMTYAARTTLRGNYIGVNLRAARYTQVNESYVEKIRPAIHQVARTFAAPLIALPISSHVQEGDREIIQQILKGYPKISVDWQRFDLPLNLIKKIGRCRVVVTGSFHPAVFALAQGIPAVGLVKSPAYQGKFGALRDEFGSACQLIHLDDARLSEKIIAAVETAWASADQVAPVLLRAAVRQIEWQSAGYQCLYDQVTRIIRARSE